MRVQIPFMTWTCCLLGLLLVLTACGAEMKTTTSASTETDHALHSETRADMTLPNLPEPQSGSEQVASVAKDEPESVETTVPEPSDSGMSMPETTATTNPEPQSPPAETAADEPKSTPSVFISILGDEEKGTILDRTEVELNKGDSVLDVLKRVTKAHKIPLEYRGRSLLSYVEGIGNLYEFDRGPTSGWLFKVNGELANKSAGTVTVQEGDSIEWIFSIKKDGD